MKLLSCRLPLTLVLMAIAQFAHATQSDNHGMHAAPAPGKVVIDGKLDDWDLSGQVLMCYDIESLMDVYSTQVATMYDTENFYVSLHWVDKTPMGNSHDPRYQPDRGWAGDAVQLRIKTDRIVHVTAWYYAPRQEPSIWIDYGKDLKTPFHGTTKQLTRTEGWKLSEGAEMAFVKDEDGRGYVQEIKLPWKLLTLEKKYTPGETFNCGFEIFWGETDWPVHRYADNLSDGASSREFFFYSINAWGEMKLDPQGKFKLPTPAWVRAMEPEAARGPIPVNYDLPADARVTLAIDDASGKRVRNLIASSPRLKGAVSEKWDGLDDNGKPVPPGEYTFNALYHKGLHVNYVMSFGSPGNPTWQTADGRGAFYGDHSAPQAAAAAGDFVALACPIGEAGKHLIGVDLTGQRLWGIANRGTVFAGKITLATDGKVLWVAQDKTGSIYRLDMKTGKYAPWKAIAKDAQGREFPMLDLQVFDPAAQQEKSAAINLTSIAVRGGMLAVALLKEGKIKLFDADTGAAKGEATVEEPRAIAYLPDGTMLALSKSRLMRVGADGKTSPFSDAELADAHSIAVDANGAVYVSVRGVDQNVKVFSADGKLQREVGKRGGRPNCGPFDANAMRLPAGIAIDSKGRLWVTEETHNPKRTSVWDADGKLALDLSGCTSYAGAGALNPYDATMGFSDNALFRIDLATGAWHTEYSFGKSGDPADLFPPAASSHTQIVMHDGKQYVYTVGEGGVIHIMTQRGGHWAAVAALGVVGKKGNHHFNAYRSPLLDEHEGALFAWTDRNGDGLVQAGELVFALPMGEKGKPNGPNGLTWGNYPGPDGTIAFHASNPTTLFRVPVAEWIPNGGPFYDIAHLNIQHIEGISMWKDTGSIQCAREGRVYINQNPLVAVDKSGKALWTYPSNVVSVHGSHRAGAARAGYLIGPSTILGTADFGGELGEVFDMNGNLGENYLFTHDGLWIQALFKDTRGAFETPERAVRGMSMDATTAGGESFGGNFIRSADGKALLTIGGTDARVLEITGLETVKRFNGKFTYTPDQYAQAQREAQEQAAHRSAAKTYKIAKVAAPIKIDGKPTEWPELLDEKSTLLEIRGDPQRRHARAQMRYDDENLYLAGRVYSQTTRMRNAGQDWRLLFKSGDAVDLMLGPSASKNGAGNLRLLMTLQDGKPIAVLNEKVAPGAATEEHFGFSSPWRTINFERVVRVPEVKFAAGPVNGGYFFEAAIPWNKLGLQPKPGLKLKGDTGILSADAGGTETTSRQYWSNKATGLVNDIPGEADLTPAMWGEFELE